MAFPDAPPEHSTPSEVISAARGPGCVMLTLAVAGQPFASVTVTPYSPAGTPVSVGPVAPVDQRKAYGPVPPCGTTVALPDAPPKHSTPSEAISAARGPGCVMLTLAVAGQPFASVTVTLYSPAGTPTSDAPVAPVDQRNVNGPVPPCGTTVALPDAPPLHATPAELISIENGAGCAIVTLAVAGQPFASVTVTV